jgi:hypothetical protein
VTPEPTDLLRGARRTLADVVLPALTDPFAIEQLKTVLRVIDHLEAVIDEAYPLEAAEAEDLRGFLAAVAQSSDPTLSTLRDASLAGSTATISEPRPTGAHASLPSFRELRDANVRRKRLVSEVIRAMRRGSAATSTQTDLEGLVRRQLDRERRWTNPRRPTK